MAFLSVQQQQELALSAAYEDDTPTPPGWRRKLIPHIGKGLVPARTDIIFIAPSGEEFKTKAQLQRYLRSQKGSPSLSEFIWITDETPRRSSRSMSKRSKSPPKSASKRKPAAGVPLEESKATKRMHTGSNENAGGPNTDKKKHCKETLGKSMGDNEVSPTWSSATADSKKNSLKATKEERNAESATQSAKVSAKAHMSKRDSELQESGKHQDRNREEAMKVNDMDAKMTVDAPGEEAVEEQISHESIKEEGGEIKSIAIEEQEAIEELLSHETIKEEGSKSENKDLENGQTACMDNQDGSKDGTTLSLLGSDFSTDGMEADSDVFESGKKESPLVEEETNWHHVENDRSENILQDSFSCAKNHLIKAAK